MNDSGKMKACANCHKSYADGFRYCPYCGAPLGKPVYIEEVFACIYGPEPMERRHTCGKCGFTWKTCEMVDSQRFCPKCGGDAPAEDLENSW